MAISIKTYEEINIMREGGKILAKTHEETAKLIKPGISTLELDQFAEDFIRQNGATPSFKGYHGFPATLCTCKNEVIVHGIPRSDEILQEGDIITIDCGVYYKGFHTDAARTFPVGEVSKEKKQLISHAYRILSEVTDKLKADIHLNEIGRLIETLAKKEGYHIVRDLTGHGIGRKLHEDPMVLNYWEGNPGPILKPGMTLAIEPIFAIGTHKMKELPDNWTLITADSSTAVQVENTFLITQDACEVLTEL